MRNPGLYDADPFLAMPQDSVKQALRLNHLTLRAYLGPRSSAVLDDPSVPVIPVALLVSWFLDPGRQSLLMTASALVCRNFCAHCLQSAQHGPALLPLTGGPMWSAHQHIFTHQDCFVFFV